MTAKLTTTAIALRIEKVIRGIGWANSAIRGAKMAANLATILQKASVVALNTTGKFSM